MKTALLFGSSGLVGGHLLNQLIKDINYSKIKLFVRAVPEFSDSKVEIIKTDFDNLQNHKEDIIGNDCFVCIGTTTKNAADKDKKQADASAQEAKEVAEIREELKNGIPKQQIAAQLAKKKAMTGGSPADAYKILNQAGVKAGSTSAGGGAAQLAAKARPHVRRAGWREEAVAVVTLVLQPRQHFE